jgi:hypothetical protein
MQGKEAELYPKAKMYGRFARRRSVVEEDWSGRELEAKLGRYFDAGI